MKKRYTIMVAGFDYHQKELKSLLNDINPMWDVTKKEAVEEYSIDEEERIYKFEKRECIFGLQAEPTNPYDPAALKVFADGTFIGYVPRGNLDVLKRLLVPGMSVWIEVFGGPYKYLAYDSEEDWQLTGQMKYYSFVKENDPVKAIIIFEWEQ